MAPVSTVVRLFLVALIGGFVVATASFPVAGYASKHTSTDVGGENSKRAVPVGTTPVPTTAIPTTITPTTASPTTAAPTTAAPTTAAPTTATPTTAVPTTATPTTAAPTTAAPTTAAPTTAAPTTATPTTEAPTTATPTTEAPTTAAPTTEAPTTAAPTTEAPTTAAPTTAAPTTAAPTTAAPTTVAPTTATPTTATPTTATPTTAEPTTPTPSATVYGYETLKTGFFVATDSEPLVATSCIALDGSAVRSGWLMDYDSGQTACCLEKGVYVSGQCNYGCDASLLASSDIFYYGSTCYHRCFDSPTDVTVTATYVQGTGGVTSVDQAYRTGVTTFDANLSTNTNPKPTYAIVNAGRTLACYGLDATLANRRRAPPAPVTTSAATVFCTGRGTLDSGKCTINTCGSQLTDGFIAIGATYCYHTCFTLSA